MPNQRGIPENTTDGTQRAGVLAPAVNATGAAIGDLDLVKADHEERIDDLEQLTETTAEQVKDLRDRDLVTRSQLDSTRGALDSRDASHDSAIGALQQRMGTLEAAQIRSGTNVAPGSSVIPPYPTGGGLSNPSIGWNPSTGAPQWQEAKGGSSGGGAYGTVTAYNATTRIATVRYPSATGETVSAACRNTSGQGLAVNDTVHITLPIQEGVQPAVTGIVARANDYQAPIYGPFSNSLPFPIRNTSIPFPFHPTSQLGFRRDSRNVLGRGATTLVGAQSGNTTRLAIVVPETGVGTLLPPIGTGGNGVVDYGFAGDFLVALLDNSTMWAYSRTNDLWQQLAVPTNAISPAPVIQGKFFTDGNNLVLWRWSYNTSSSPHTITLFKVVCNGLSLSEAQYGAPISTDTSGYTSGSIYAVVSNGSHVWIAHNGGSSYEYHYLKYRGSSGGWFTAYGAWRQGSFMSVASNTFVVQSTGALWMLGDIGTPTTSAHFLSKVSVTGSITSSQWAQPSGSADGVASANAVTLVGSTMVIAGASISRESVGSNVYYSTAKVWTTDGATTSVALTGVRFKQVLSNGQNPTVVVPAVFMRQAPEGGNRFLACAYQGNETQSYNDIYVTLEDRTW